MIIAEGQKALLVGLIGILATCLVSCSNSTSDFDVSEPKADPLYLGDTIPWTQRPTVEESRKIIPLAVIESRRIASVTMRCRMTADGGLTACIVDGESPPAQDLDAAALLASKLTRIEPRLRNGRSVEGLYAQVTMTFDVGGPRNRQDIRIWPSISGSRLFESMPVASRFLR